MKTMLKFTALVLAIGFSACSDAAPTNAASSTAISGDLGFDFYQGRSNKIASVDTVTPAHIRARYENGFLSRQIPRTELTGALAQRYPYDAEKAAAYYTQKSTEAAQRAAARQTALAQREQAIETEIAKLTQRDVELQKEVFTLRHMPRGTVARSGCTVCSTSNKASGKNRSSYAHS